MRGLPILLLLVATPVAAPAAGMPRPYLAVFTFQQGHLEQISTDQMRVLDASPFDGMAFWAIEGYSTEKPPGLDALRPRLQQLRAQTRKHLWPFAFLNRVLQQESADRQHTSARRDPAFARIRGMDLDNETGARDCFLATWRLNLRIARLLDTPGVGLDPEFYNNYALESIAELARRRGETVAETQRKLRALGRSMADVVAEEYPGAVLWCLFARLAGPHEAVVGAPETADLIPIGAPGCVLQGILDRAREARIPLTLIEGSEGGIGYLNRSLDDLRRKIVVQERFYRSWKARYPQLILGGTIAPWLDIEHRAYWMKDEPAAGKIEEFGPFFTTLMQHLPFVWVYGAGKAYHVWEKPYADRFHPVLAAAKERARKEPAPALALPVRYQVPTGPPPGHVTLDLGDLLVDLGRPAAETGVRLTRREISGGAREVELRPESRSVGGGRFTAVLAFPPWEGDEKFQWPGASIPLAGHGDWRAYRCLAVEVHNPDDQDAEIGVSAADGAGGTWHRYYRVPARRAGVCGVPTEQLPQPVYIAGWAGRRFLFRGPPPPTRFYLSPVVLVKRET